MSLVVCQLSRDVIGYEDVKCHWCVSIRVSSQFNNRLLLVKLWILQSFSRAQFCLSPSLSRLYGAGNCWLRFIGVWSKLVNQLPKVLDFNKNQWSSWGRTPWWGSKSVLNWSMLLTGMIILRGHLIQQRFIKKTERRVSCLLKLNSPLKEATLGCLFNIH